MLVGRRCLRALQLRCFWSCIYYAYVMRVLVVFRLSLLPLPCCYRDLGVRMLIIYAVLVPAYHAVVHTSVMQVVIHENV